MGLYCTLNLIPQLSPLVKEIHAFFSFASTAQSISKIKRLLHF